MNPCPCGYVGSETRCTCTEHQIQKYRHRLSGPLLDRIDIQAEVPRRKYVVTSSEQNHGICLSTALLKEKVIRARERQSNRYKACRIKLNADVSVRVLKRAVAMTTAARTLLVESVDVLGLSARAADKVQRIARTAADLAERERVEDQDIAEAVSYRILDRRID